jgi:hypothetical protein
MNVAEGTRVFIKSLRGFRPSHVGSAWTDNKYQRTRRRQNANNIEGRDEPPHGQMRFIATTI